MFIYGEYGAAGAAKASEKLFKSQPRVFFLRGKMEAQESHAVFELERGMFPEGMLELDLVHLGFCLENSADGGNHRHFEGPRRTPYPIRAATYQRTIRKKVPRPIPLTSRRRTIYFVPPEDLQRPGRNPELEALALLQELPGNPDDDDDDDDPAAGAAPYAPASSGYSARFKRTAEQEEGDSGFRDAANPSKRVRRALGDDDSAANSPYKIFGVSSFASSAFVTLEAAAVADLTIPGLCDKIQACFKKAELRFLELYPSWPTIKFIISDTQDAARSAGRPVIAIPPKC